MPAATSGMPVPSEILETGQVTPPARRPKKAAELSSDLREPSLTIEISNQGVKAAEQYEDEHHKSVVGSGRD